MRDTLDGKYRASTYLYEIYDNFFNVVDWIELLPAQADSKLIQAFKRTRLTGIYQIVCWFHLKEKAVIQRQVIVSSTIYWS